MTVVWFEAWRYQHEKAPVVALLQEIRTQLPLQAKALQGAKKLGEVAIRGALLSLEDLTRRIGFQASKIQAAGEEWEERNLATRLPSHLIRDHLENALKELLGRKGRKKSEKEHRLVVLVDDLDRCEPETAYQLLEGIKIYLNLPSCVFVLGMNQRILEGAVAKHLALEVDYGGDGTSAEEREQSARRYLGAKSREYMEKICRDIWHLPLVREPDQLLGRLLPGFPGLADIQRIVQHYRCLPPIPRKIKGYANLLLRFEPHIEQIKKGIEDTPVAGPGVDFVHSPVRDLRRWAGLAVAFSYLYHFRHPLYRLLWSERREFLVELQRWSRGERESRVQRHVQGLFLRRSGPEVQEDRASTSEHEELLAAFHDPADEIFHVQDLLADLGPITDSEIDLCLLR